MKISNNIDIQDSVENVWNVVMNPRSFKDWVTIHHSLDRVDEGALRVGFQVDQTLSLSGIHIHVHWLLTEQKPPYRAVWEGVGPKDSRAQITYNLTANNNGETNFEYINNFIPPGGRAGSFASHFVIGRISEREAKKSLACLKLLLEGHDQ